MGFMSTYPAALHYDVAWNSGPLQAVPPALFSSLDARVLRPSTTERGRQYELDRNEAGTWRPPLDNRDGALDPSNPASPYAPNVVPYRPCRIRAIVGVNALSVDQATAGEKSGYLGPVTALSKLGVVNDFGYPVSIIASGAAWQGSQVYQAVLPSGAVQYSTIVMVQQVHVQPGAWYSFSAYAQVTAGNSPQANCGLIYFDNAGNELAANGGASATLTAGAGTWTQLTVSAQAPTTAYAAWVKVEISGAAALSAATTFLVDGLQFEASMTPTPWQMPLTVSQNLLPRAIATGTQSINPVSDTPGNWFQLDSSGSLAQATWLPAPASGQSTALAWTSPAGTTSNSHLYVGLASSFGTANGPVQDITQVTAGTAYTGSVYLSRTSSADATVQVTVGFRWFDQFGNLLSTSAGTAVTVPTGGAWVRGTCTATAPTGAAWGRMRIAITTPSSTTASNTVFCAGWQLEAASAATAWADPGPTRYIFTGFLEQYPQKWRLSGTWGELDAIGVDALGGLGQDQFQDPFLEELLALEPTFLYTLNDPAGSTTVVDAAGNCPAGVVGTGPGGPGSLTLGSGISATSAALSFGGTQGPVADFANTASTNPQSAMAYVALPRAATTPNAGLVSGLGGTSTSWTRMIAFNAPAATPASPMYLWSATMNALQSPQPCEISFYLDTAGHLNIELVGSVVFTHTYSTQSYLDGDWHLVSVSVDNVNGTSVVTSLDGVVTASTASGSANPVNLSRDTIGGRIQDPAPAYTGGANASVALAVQFPFILSTAQIANLYQSWRNASAGESTGARIARVLNWVGWKGPTAIDTGATSDMGPASDLTGSSALDALNTVTETENGNIYAATDGKIVFKARTARYNQNTPAMILGEMFQWGEWPYEDVQLPTDPIHTYNDIQAQQYQAYSQFTFYSATQQTALAASTASQLQNFDRVLAKTLNVQNFAEVQEAAAYLLGQYQTPTMRAKAVKLNVSAVPGLFAACLALEVGSRIRIMRRAPWRATAIQFDGFVERISWNLDPRGPASCTLECSPAERGQYWTMAALSTTLATQAASGQNQATIDALPDAAYNALNSSLPQGYQLTFDPGTQFAETLTIQPPLPATSPGYSTATLTFTSNFTYTHQAGAVVCEPLPSGYTNPAVWNPNSLLGAGYAEFDGAAFSGSSQIAITPWTDAATNPLSCNLATGDLLWLGPGTADWEGYNLFNPNVSTAGEGALPLPAGTAGSAVGVSSALGSPTVTASGSAWQGAQVWQVGVSASGTAGFRLIRSSVTATPGTAFSASFYVRSVTTGANPQVAAQMVFLGSNGATISSVTGTASTLTGSASAAWTRVTVSGTAPAGAAGIQAGVVLAATGPSSAWSFQADGMQVEPNPAPSAYQTCPQVLSVVPGGSSSTMVLVNLVAPLANNHASGEYVCDPLPPGTSSPLAAAAVGTARLAY